MTDIIRKNKLSFDNSEQTDLNKQNQIVIYQT